MSYTMKKMFSEANNYAKLLTHVSNFLNRFGLSFPAARIQIQSGSAHLKSCVSADIKELVR
jgi:hypothetical protein